MNHKFTLGVIAGIASLAVAVPLLAQISSAASSTSAAPSSAVTQTAPAAQVSQSAAEQTALAAHPGTLSAATRLNNHFSGYKVEVTGSDGKEYDEIVDPTTGQITDSWVDGQGGPRGGHGPWAPNANEQPDVQPSSSN